MTLLESPTLACSQARSNLARNLAALRENQPQLVAWVSEAPLSVEWVFARDRALSAIDTNGQWLGGCSVPRRAAAEMLQRLEVNGSVACLLAPSHAAQIRQTLDRLRPEQAVIVVAPDHTDLASALHCDDFSADLADHRLWFAAGAGWEAGLARLFDDHPGLAVPGSFVRLPDTDPAQAEALIREAQAVFSAVSAQRDARLRSLCEAAPAPRAANSRLLVVAPTRFRLWNDIGFQMLQSLSGLGPQVVVYDADDPLNGSPHALVRAAADCGAILTANTARTDLPGILPDSIRWLTWVTTGRIPSRALTGPNDHLLVVDPALQRAAIQAGWDQNRVHLAGWPGTQVGPAPANAPVTIIADTLPLDVPKDLIEYSSHSLLWEAIAQDLRRDPTRLRDVNAYLDDAMRRASVSDAAFPRARFIQQAIVPAYQQGIALALLKARIPLRVFGREWDKLAELKGVAAGPIETREELQQAVAGSCALVHVWPGSLSHPLHACSRPIVRPTWLLADAQAALSGRLAATAPPLPPISDTLLQPLLESA